MRRLLVTALTICVLSVMGEMSYAESVTTKTYKKLTEVQELFGESRIEDAITELEELLKEVKQGSLDQALTLQMLGYAEMGAERFEKAISYLKKSLSLNKLPENVKYNIGYMVAQLHAARSEFEEALSFAATWFKTLESPTPSQHMFMANIYAQIKRYEEALPYATRAIESSESPRESWYQLVTAAYFELNKFPEAANTLTLMVEIWPESPSYWEQLASIYLLLEEDSKALAVLKLAWENDVLNKEKSVRTMVQLAIRRSIPEHAARLLTLAMTQDILPREEKYVSLLANAWISAREDNPAITALEELAELQQKGDPLIRVANLYIDNGDWKLAETSLQRAIEMGLDEPGKAWLLLGISLSEQKKFKESFTALSKARQFPKTRKQSNSWLKYAEEMRRQDEWQRSFQG